MNKIYLCLENGLVFEGESFGADCTAIGEIVFETSMVGYTETLTDNNYKGQIVVKTFPMIGNYGMVFDTENKAPALSALVVREWCDTPSNFRSEGNLSDYLKTYNIPAICGIDTRELTRIIRNEGTMNAIICKEPPENTEIIKNYKFSCEISQGEKEIKRTENSKFKVALLNLGNSDSAVKTLLSLGAEVCIFPYSTNVSEIETYNPHGIFISDGSEALLHSVNVVKELIGKYPVFATGTGHVVLAYANNLEIQKHKYGHRGSNQPCVCIQSGKTYITTQNHGFIVNTSSPSENVVISFINANDKTCEGLEYKNGDFSVQFRPDAYDGVNNTLFLYEKFIKNMESRLCH